jgi:hypothetical protein
MPAPTPQITLTFTLLDFEGNELGSALQPAWLRVALCNFGSFLPRVPGAGVIGEVSSWFVDIPFIGAGQQSIKLWGNDVIVPGPDVTYYQISVLDTNKNLVQTGLYQFDGTQTIDLSNATPITPGQPPSLPSLQYLPCTGAVPGSFFTAPGQVIAAFYNGVALPRNQALPTLSYTLSGGISISLNFTAETGTPDDRIDALCIVG